MESYIKVNGLGGKRGRNVRGNDTLRFASRLSMSLRSLRRLARLDWAREGEDIRCTAPAFDLECLKVNDVK
jgi:hypothetical protein